MDQLRQNTRSTKNNTEQPEPKNPDGTNKTHEVFTTVVDLHDETNKMFSDLTGKFPQFSSRGYQYIVVLYHYDSNAILIEPVKDRKGPVIFQAHKKLFDRLRKSGCPPKLHKMDNEAPKDLKRYMDDTNIDYQLVPPHIHRRNAAERAIRTFKNHFIAGLCSLDPNFPMHLWDLLLPQAELTRNLLQN